MFVASDILTTANSAGLPANTVTGALGLLRDVRETLVQVQTPLDEAIEVTNSTFVQVCDMGNLMQDLH